MTFAGEGNDFPARRLNHRNGYRLLTYSSRYAVMFLISLIICLNARESAVYYLSSGKFHE